MQLLRQVASLEEKIDILNQRHFGRNTEKASEIDDLQISFDLDCLNALNEAEHILDSSTGENDEPDPAQPVCKRTKRKGKRGEGIRVADAPEKLLPNSILTPSLAAGIFNAKYLNAVPLTRLGEDFARIDMNISRQTLANWMINISDRYLGLIYRRMHQVLMDSKLIHCDETPFKLVTPDKKPNSKAYMWVYHTMEAYDSHPIFLYDYQGVRSSKIPR